MSLDRSSVTRGRASTCSLTLGVLTVLLIHRSFGQDIVFPGERPPTTERTGVTVDNDGNVCPRNMSWTQEPQEREGICECIAGNLYYPRLDRCFLQYTIGPCERGKIFILQRNAEMAKCVANPCPKRNTVWYKGACHSLYVTGGPCKSDETLTVPDTSTEPKCVGVVAENYQIITAPRKFCGPGSRRVSQGRCRAIIP